MKSRKRGLAALILLLGNSFLGHSAPATVQSVTDANNQFGVGLFQEAAKNSPDKNIFLSPLSASMALQMLINGAAGQTYIAMSRTLGIQGYDLKSLNASNRKILNALTAKNRSFTLNIANSVWVDHNFKVRDSFTNSIRSSYLAETNNTLDMKAAESGKVINNWVKEKTQGKIAQLFPDKLPANSKAVLVNTTYFKAEWTRPFTKKEHFTREFHSGGGKTKVVPMMGDEREIAYTETKGFQGAALPYGTDGSAKMIFILPKEGQKFAPEFFADAIQTVEVAPIQRVKFALPRFTFSYEFPLVQPLNNLGMGVAFTDSADFSLLSATPLAITGAIQKSFVAVDEKGTEAAAATGTMMGATAVYMDPPVSLTLDRPFYFVIRDRAGTNLFMGYLADPVLE